VQSLPSELVGFVSHLPRLRLLIVYGSRARDDAHERSDWDFGYLADEPFDELELRAALPKALRSDAIDVADLSHAGALLRYQAARDGELIFERLPGTFEQFSYDAILFWLDAQHAIRSAHEAILESLG
jgi:predicted nucleotidyltransferase